MDILIVVATKSEIEPLLAKMDSCREEGSSSFVCHYKENEIEFLITGVGMVSTALRTGYTLFNAVEFEYDLAINIGICGSFNKNLEIGTVVNVIEDCFSELGAEDGDDFLSLEDMGLNGVTKVFPKDEEEYQVENYIIDLLPKVNGITVNTAHGNERSIDKVVQRFHPMIETMEGAGFLMACEGHGTPYVQIRAVSNYVEKRNKDAWNIPLAIKNLNEKVLEIIDAF